MALSDIKMKRHVLQLWIIRTYLDSLQYLDH